MADTKSINWGTTAYGTVADAATLDLGTSTDACIEAWVYPTALPANNTEWNSHPIIAKWEPSMERSYYFGLGKTSGGVLTMDIVGSNAGSDSVLTNKAMTSYSANTWIYVAFVYTDSTGVIEFFQGDESTSPTSLGTTSGNVGFFAGNSRVQVARGDNVTNATFPGLFAELRIWRGARTLSELQNNYAPSAISSGTNLIDLWDFNDTATDIISSNTLSYTNSPSYSTNIPVIGGASGPANLKSYNTNLKANIKSYNTNLIANIKSINTNV